MSNASSLIQSLDRRRVFLVGDTIVDIYVYGQALGKSNETPTIVAKELDTKVSLGGAFLVARNMLELGAQVSFLTLVGNDAEADRVRALNHMRLNKILICDSSRRTTSKKRFWVDGYKLLQFDNLDNRPLSEDLQRSAEARVREATGDHDLVVIADNRHGLLSPSLIRSILQTAKDTGKQVFVDSQVSQSEANHVQYYGADAFCLNLREAQALDPEFAASDQLSGFGRLQRKLGSEKIIVKLGEDGCIAAIDGNVYRAGAMKVDVVDTCGAGDAFLAALTLCGLENPAVSLRAANTWAGLSVQVHGAEPAAHADFQRLMTS